jgi:chloramphenicol-sensitive protein RarD
MTNSPAPTAAARPPGRSGLTAAVAAFAMWGVFPLYLKPLSGVPALQVMSHRIVWCCVVVFAWLAVRRELASVGAALSNPGIRRRLAASALCISVNWLIYTWAVTHSHVVDASLGYFINPLVSVVLGVFVLHERLNRVQWAAVAIAGAGVLYLAIALERPPWIALALAASFGLYGLIRKVVPVDSVPGLATETLLVAPFAAVYLVWCQAQGSGALFHSSTTVDVLLLLSGVVTATPLALFAYGARRIPLSLVGLVQYIGPTLQFLIGVYVFGEAFPPARAVGFAMIWSALVIYAADGLWRRRLR